MASEIKANKISPATGTAFTIGDSGDTFTVPSGATLAFASGAAISNAGTASGFGKVLQVVNATYGSQETTTSTSFVATSLTASITPSSTSSKILVLLHVNVRQNGLDHVIATIYRDTTNLGDATWGMGQDHSHSNSQTNFGFNWLDSPSTTSSTTYTLYFRSYNGNTVYTSPNGEEGSITLIEIEA